MSLLEIHEKSANKDIPACQYDVGSGYEFGAWGIEQDYEKAAKHYEMAARQGFLPAQYRLGLLYEEGKGVEQSYEKAAEWYRKAAEQRNGEAQYKLGYFYEYGYGVEKSYEKAAQLYEEASIHDSLMAKYRLGRLCELGRGVKQDYKKVAQLYEEIVEDYFEKTSYLKDEAIYIIDAQYRLGRLYERGQGVKQNYENAIEKYGKAAAKNNSWALSSLRILANKGFKSAQYYLGYLYENGYGVEQSDKKAAEWYGKAAEQGYGEAQKKLGYFYEKGYGVEQSYEKAIEWYEKAIEQGKLVNQFHLGCLYEEIQDFEKAAKMYRIEAEDGDKEAQYKLGILYLLYIDGIGVNQKYEKAAEWFKKAAEQGDKASQEHLGYLYENGYGVEQSYEKATEWYEKATEQGKEHYCAKIIKNLKPTQVMIINDISEILTVPLDKKYRAIKILPTENNHKNIHTVYSLEDWERIKTAVEKFLEDIDVVKEDKSNELDVFMQIYVKLGKLISSDSDENEHLSYEKLYTNRNLVGGLLEGKCVCGRLF